MTHRQPTKRSQSAKCSVDRRWCHGGSGGIIMAGLATAGCAGPVGMAAAACHCDSKPRADDGVRSSTGRERICACHFAFRWPTDAGCYHTAGRANLHGQYAYRGWPGGQ